MCKRREICSNRQLSKREPVLVKIDGNLSLIPTEFLQFIVMTIVYALYFKLFMAVSGGKSVLNRYIYFGAKSNGFCQYRMSFCLLVNQGGRTGRGTCLGKFLANMSDF